jgi:hypothetical protein
MNALSGLLWTIAVIVLVLWILGLVTSNAFGGLVHVLLVLFIVIVVLEVVRSRRT